MSSIPITIIGNNICDFIPLHKAITLLTFTSKETFNESIKQREKYLALIYRAKKYQEMANELKILIRSSNYLKKYNISYF